MKTCVIVDFTSILSVLKPYVFTKATQHTNNIDIELQAIAIAPCDEAQLQHILYGLGQKLIETATSLVRGGIQPQEGNSSHKCVFWHFTGFGNTF